MAAFAMFNRHRQWVTEADLDADLLALLGGPATPSRGLRAELTATQTVIGRFFFVHEAQASRDDAQLKTYEFLHSTFGEYLIARFVVRELVALTTAAELTSARSRPDQVDDSFLYSILSFAALSTRGTAVSFLSEQVAALPADTRQRMRAMLISPFHHALHARQDQKYGNYQPGHPGVPERHAAYSANLVILAVVVGGEVHGRELFPDTPNPVRQWTKMTYLWRSQLMGEGWNRLVHTIAVHREWNDVRDVRDVWLTPATAELDVSPVDLTWSYSPHVNKTFLRYYGFTDLRLHGQFMCERTDDTIMHALEPLDSALVTTVFTLPDGRKTTPANVLITMLAAETSTERLRALHALTEVDPDLKTSLRRSGILERLSDEPLT